jgi:acetate---CoA ligase (ADP-forming)
VQVLPANADEADVIAALGQLRAAKLLGGVRGAPPADVAAVAKAAMAVGRLIQTVPEIAEIEINPLMVHGKGEGATALDALMVCRD